jgi:hypothetical protein
MATVDEILAAAERADKAGDAPAAKVLRDRAAQMQGPSPEVIQAAADRAKAAGDQAAYDALVARLPAAPAMPDTGPAIPTADTEDPAAKDARLVAMFDAANPALAGRYRTAAELPRVGDAVIGGGGGGGRGGAPRVTVQPWQNVKADTFGDTAAAMMEGPVAGMKAFGGGLVGGESPSRSYLKEQGVPGVLAAPLGVVGDIGGAALSGLGAGISGAIGLGAELVPGQGKQAEQKLAEDVTGMTMFAVPELAGASSIIGKGATVTGKVKVPQIGTKSWRNAYGVSEAKPTVESLRAAKNEAYKAVDEAGEAFEAPEMGALRDKVKAELDAGNYVSGVDKQTDAVVSLLDRKAGEKMTIGQLDKLRQEFYKRLAAAPNEVGIEDAIDAIDEMIASRADTNELMQAARLSNSRYKKAEMLDIAFQKAKDQTAATGSGGNILNKMRQAVVSIIDNPKRARWFQKDEIDAMRAFVEGSTGQNAMRLFGKLSPNGNGLMMALNLGAAGGTGGLSLLATAAATGAKALADSAAIKGGDALIGKVAGAAKREAPQAAQGRSVAVPVPVAPSGGQAATSDYETLWRKYAQ